LSFGVIEVIYLDDVDSGTVFHDNALRILTGRLRCISQFDSARGLRAVSLTRRRTRCNAVRKRSRSKGLSR
jgi:hypothetical protein